MNTVRSAANCLRTLGYASLVIAAIPFAIVAGLRTRKNKRSRSRTIPPPMPPSTSRYGGMSVGDRLFVAGLREPLKEAVELRRREAIIAILHELDIGEESASAVADSLLANPGAYGF